MDKRTEPEAPTSDADPLLLELSRSIDPMAATPRRFEGTARYRVVRRLGEGGFGVVYEVHDRQLDRRLALKLLLDERSAQVEWLKQEFRSAADLVHPNLVGLHELVAEDGWWFITMELVEGVDLLTHVDRPPASEEDATPLAAADLSARYRRLRRALRQLAEGVSATHAAGKLHRDLKPSNVHVDARGRVVILDFGLAQDLTVDATRGAYLPGAGTPEYMAPEQLQGAGATRASDWYAVGVMLYELLTGRRPFSGSRSELVHAKTSREPPAPSELQPSIPEDLERLCMSLLARDPTARPTGAQILEQLGARSPTDSLAPVARPAQRLVGRLAVLDRLEAGLGAVSGGKSAILFVHGEPGVGKTAVCEHFVRRALQERRALVLAARCYERESVPFKALDGVIDALSERLRNLGRAEAAALMPRDIHLLLRLFPVLDRVEALRAVPVRQKPAPDLQELRRRAFDALKELLGRLADRQPLVVFIDDLHWGDLDSARLLSELLGPPDPPALLFVGTYRTTARAHSEALQALLIDPSGSGREHPEIHLEGLTTEESRELATALASGPIDDEKIERAVTEARGHPLFLAELLQEEDDAPTRPKSLREVILARVAGLEDDARSLLETIAIAGRPITQGVCFEAAGVGAVGADAVRLLTARHLVRRSGPEEQDWVEPYHDRVREAVAAAAAGSVARARHLALAAALQGSGGDPETLAEHFDAGGDTRQAGRYAVVAADGAFEAMAFDRAAKLYEMALDRLDPDGDERAVLLAKLGQALANAGRGGEAGRAFLASSELASGDVRDLRRLAAEQLLVSGHEQEGFDVILPLLREIGVSYPSTPRWAFARAVWNGLRLSARGSGFQERDAGSVSREALLKVDVLESACRGLEFTHLWFAVAFEPLYARLALESGEPSRVARALAVLISHHGVEKGVGKAALDAFDTAKAYAERHDDARALADVHRQMGLSLAYGSARYREAVESFERAEEILTTRCTGNIRDLRFCRQKKMNSLLRLGELRALQRLSDPYLREAVDRGDHLARAAMQTYAKAPLLLAADDSTGALRVLSSIALPSQGVYWLYHAAASSDAHLYEGNLEAAREVWQRYWPKFEESLLGLLPVFGMDATRSHAVALTAQGDPASLKRATELAKTMNAKHVLPCRASREGVLGCVAAYRGQRERAIRLLDSARRAFAEAEMKLYAAAHQRAVGQLSGRQALVNEADHTLRNEGVARPDRWARMYAPIGMESEAPLR